MRLPSVVGASLAPGLILLASCSPDLRESAGPIVPIPEVPVPNVTGTVLRDGLAAPDVEVRLIVIEADTTWDEARTDADGRYAFADVPAGSSEIEVKSSDPRDFAKVAVEFVLPAAEAMYEAPDLDIALAGMALLTPEEDVRVPTPRFAAPLTFTWNPSQRPATRSHVRLYDDRGAAVWYGPETGSDRIVWNGIANRGDRSGRPVEAGEYQWRLRVETDGSEIEWNTAYRRVTFTETER